MQQRRLNDDADACLPKATISKITDSVQKQYFSIFKNFTFSQKQKLVKKDWRMETIENCYHDVKSELELWLVKQQVCVWGGTLSWVVYDKFSESF